jgi:hypothetical protein
MKSTKLKLTLIVISFICIHFLTFQSIHANNVNEKYITKFDVEMLAEKHLQDFRLVRKRVIWNRGRNFLYKNYIEQINLSIQVGLYASAKHAEEVALDYIKYLSIQLIENPFPELSIGDKSWGEISGFDKITITGIIFIKNNALVMISSRNYRDIKELAKAIDVDITNEAAYISLENAIQIPKINSVSIGKSNLREGESTKITINATDFNLESLEYVFFPGLIKEANDPENVFTLIASKEKFPGQFLGSHAINIVLINKSNVVSPVKTIEFNCIE